MTWGDILGIGAQELRSTIETKEFQHYWNVKKDDSSVCSDCEFRYACMDRRIPEPRLVLGWFHATECPYNPYICKWQGEEGYRTLAECGVVSNAEDFSIDHERIAAINAELWGE